MNRKLYQSKPFETEGMNVFDIAERLARVNASDCRRATGPVSVVIHENTEDSLRLSLCDGIQSSVAKCRFRKSKTIRLFCTSIIIMK